MTGLPFERLLDAMPDGVVLVERSEGRWPLPKILYVNQPAARLVGLANETMVGRSMRCLRGRNTDPARFRRLIEAVQSGSGGFGRIALRGPGDIDVEADIDIQMLDDRALLTLSDRFVRKSGAEDRVTTSWFGGLTDHYFYQANFRGGGQLCFDEVEPGFVKLLMGPDGKADKCRDLTPWVVPDDWPQLRDRLRNLVSGEPSEVTFRLKCFDGEIRQFRDRARPVIREGKQVDRVVGALMPIPAAPNRVQASTAEQDLARLIAQSLHRLTFLLGQNGRLLWASPEPATDFADRLRANVGVHIETLWPVEQADLWLDALDRVAETGEKFSFRSSWTLSQDVRQLDCTLIPLSPSLVLAVVNAAVQPPHTVMADQDANLVELDLAELARKTGLGYAILQADGQLAAVDPVVGAAWALDEHGSIVGPEWLRKLAPVTPLVEPAKKPGLAEAGSDFAILSPIRDGEFNWHMMAASGPAMAAGSSLLLAAPVTTRTQPSTVGFDGWPARILDQIAEGAVIIDLQGTVLWVNRALCGMTAMPRSGLIGRGLGALLAPNDAGREAIPQGWLAPILEQAKAGLIDGADLQAHRADGTLFPIDVRIQPVSRAVLPANDTDDTAMHASDEADATPDALILLITDLTNELATEATFKSLAYHDQVTGLANRLLFYDRLNRVIDQHPGDASMVGVLLIDLDRFKVINDSLGLERGDQLLKAVADRFDAEMSEHDMLARLGGDEFMVLMESAPATAILAERAQRLIEVLASPIDIADHEFTVSASIGIAVYPTDGDDVETLLKNADTALTRTKESGRGHYQFYTTGMNAAALERLMLESRLRRALEQGELVVYYQPQVSLETGQITGAEALIRWFHPELGMVSPGDFIPVAEETGLIESIGSWVLERSLIDLRQWHEMGFTDLSVAVNLSARQFGQLDLVEHVSELLTQTGVAANYLTLELTESVIMRDAQDTITRLQELRALGVGLSVDDFGTGYSSLGYLRRFPIGALKIDRSFTRDIDAGEYGDAIPRAIVAMSASLGLKVVAEGVETEAQLLALREFGCDEMQGFLFSKPLPADQMTALLHEGRGLTLP